MHDGRKRNFVWSHPKFPLDFLNLSSIFGFSQIRRQRTILKYQVAKLQFCNSLDRCLSTILVILKLLLKIMKEYPLKQPKATCVLFSIACKINLGLIKNNGNPGGRGGLWPWKSGWEGGVTVI